jgi:hypothetical protein
MASIDKTALAYEGKIFKSPGGVFLLILEF